MKIKNIAEAQEAAAAIADFMNRFNQTLGVLGSLAGNVNDQQKEQIVINDSINPASADVKKQSTSIASQVGTPLTINERLFTILRESGKPMTPKEITNRYIELGWPPPSNGGKVYGVLLASAYYQSKKGKLKNDGGRYSIVEQSQAQPL